MHRSTKQAAQQIVGNLLGVFRRRQLGHVDALVMFQALVEGPTPGMPMPIHHQPPRHPPPSSSGDDEPLVDPGRSLGLRLLALLGAFSFLMIGISSIVPLLQPLSPPPMPDQRDGPIT
jgi:hypothetical protein